MALQLGDQIRKVNLKVPCFFIIGDMQGGTSFVHVPLHIQTLYDAYVVHATLQVVMLEIQTLNVPI